MIAEVDSVIDLPAQVKDIKHVRFGRLVAVEFMGMKSLGSKKYAEWKFNCDCGKVIIRTAHNVVSGRTASCGCLKKETANYRNSATYDIFMQLNSMRVGGSVRCADVTLTKESDDLFRMTRHLDTKRKSALNRFIE